MEVVVEFTSADQMYPVLGCFMMNRIDSKKHSTFFTLIYYSLFTTLLEYGAFSVGIVVYGNGWNIGWTFISYFVAYMGVMVYRILVIYLDS